MHYFFDNCLSPKHAGCLKALGVSVEHLRDTLNPAIKDPELFKKLVGKDLVFVSSDMNQLTTANELLELKKLGCTAIYFAPFFHKKILWEQAAWIIRWWPKIDGFVNGAAKGTIAEIQQNGKALPRVW